jgi:hypothetical protein
VTGQAASLLPDATTNIGVFAIAARRGNATPTSARSNGPARTCPKGSYGRHDRQAIAARETRVAASGCALSSRSTAPRPSTTPRPGRPSPPGHSGLQSVRPTERSSLSKRPSNPYQTIGDSAVTRCQHRGGGVMSEHCLRCGYSDFTPAEKPFVIYLRSRADMVRRFACQIGSFPLVRAIPVQENVAIQFGSGAYHPAMGPREIKGIYGNQGSLAWSRTEEPRPVRRGRADLDFLAFPLDYKRTIDND